VKCDAAVAVVMTWGCHRSRTDGECVQVESSVSCEEVVSKLPADTVMLSYGGDLCLDYPDGTSMCVVTEDLEARCQALFGDMSANQPCPDFLDFIRLTGWLDYEQTEIAAAAVMQCDSVWSPTRRYDAYSWYEDRSDDCSSQSWPDGCLGYIRHEVLFDTEKGTLLSIKKEAVRNIDEVWCCNGAPTSAVQWGEPIDARCDLDTAHVYAQDEF